MELFAKIVQKLKTVPYFCKTSILDAWQGSEYASEALIHEFSNLMLCSQMLANTIEIFQNIYYVDLHFTLWCQEFFLHTLHLPWFSAPGNVLCHQNKHLMGYFEFLHGSRIICLFFNILEKLH